MLLNYGILTIRNAGFPMGLVSNPNNKRAQHIYERLGFKIVQVRENSWKNQFGELQSSVDYELYRENFNSFVK